MNLSTDQAIQKPGHLLTVFLTEIVKDAVSKMEKKQNIRQVKITNEKGIEVLNTKWIKQMEEAGKTSSMFPRISG